MLDKLPYSDGAAYDSRLWEHRDRCLPDTRVQLRRQIVAWYKDPSGPCIFWLNGMAGTGKSTIARTVANDFVREGWLAASFFFSRGGGNLSHAGHFVTTIAIQLTNKSQPLKRYICDAIRNNRNIATQSLQVQWKQLILSPLSMLSTTSLQTSLVLVIDALDECDGDDDIRLLLQLFAETISIKSIRLRVFVTSRPDTSIRLGFRAIPGILHHDLVLHDISRSIVDHDISVFFKVRFRDIRESSNYLPADWPGDKTIDRLVDKAGGLFIYAATVCRFIKTHDLWSPQQLLEVFLPSETPDHSQTCTRKIPSTSPTAELDTIYTQILTHSIRGVSTDEDMKELAKDFKQVIGTIVILSESLSATALGELLDLKQETVHLTLRHLRSVLNVPDDNNLPIRLLHPSFRDFLLDKERCHDLLFWIDEKKAHENLALRCLQRLTDINTGLKRDICNLREPDTLARDVGSSVVEQHLPTVLQYACLYWVQHLQRSEAQHDDDAKVHDFLRKHLLHWLEALSLIGKTSEGVLGIALLESMINVSVSKRIRGLSLTIYIQCQRKPPFIRVYL